MLWKKDMLFCDINPACYAISMQKEILKRHIQNICSREKLARTVSQEKLPNLVSAGSSHLIKRGPGIDPILQENKAVNIELAGSAINGIVIYPGEVFSFWRLVGNTTKRKGYKEGRVIEKNRIKPGMGGGLCNLANTIHRVILHSPLEVVEFHSHSDALAPDEGERIPFSSGTSINYNNRDYRFRNNTEQPVQLLVWCAEETLYVELRSECEYPWTYRLVEENHHFAQEGGKYYRISQIYKETLERGSEEVLERTMVRDNHSEVMYDYSLIPGVRQPSYIEADIRADYRKLTKLLFERQLTVTTMESATGGQIASLITDTEGSSAVLKGAFITYCNEAKLMQGVPEEILNTYTVYSKETAAAMAQACAEAYGADIGIGVTGTMGNIDTENSQASVPGQVYFAIRLRGDVRAYYTEIRPQPTRLAYKLAVAKEIYDALMERLQ